MTPDECVARYGDVCVEIVDLEYTLCKLKEERLVLKGVVETLVYAEKEKCSDA